MIARAGRTLLAGLIGTVTGEEGLAETRGPAPATYQPSRRMPWPERRTGG